MVCSAAFLIDLKDIQIFRIFRMRGDKSDEDNFDGLFCCISAKQTLCTDGFLFTSMMIDLVEKLSCANCFLATIFRRYLNIGILAHFCLAGSDVSVQVSSTARCVPGEILWGPPTMSQDYR